jgi:hypothetical protein
MVHPSKLNEMTNEELMLPRFNVIADYPNSSFDIGDILEQDEKHKTNYWVKLQLYTSRYPDKYPNIFRKLEWWEERVSNS